ncbi:SusC/RagA family TonB-linked outer membrane protein [Chitinophaga alhagiae]|uniref:SusC/RagA family TonB-linked outer membrane protein n=1 Tax=Chitinophaga alhagiae TaxID=2203219 RepID=UPI0018E52516|nr:TonB-dependent receptor [Chitinophaga alhagiae]
MGIPFLLLLLLGVLYRGQAQDRKRISGTVTDAQTGEPVPGVSIRVKHTNTGGSADASGRFNIQAAASDTLVFTIVGYTRRELRVGNSTTLQVRLSQSTTTLNEVEVGYGAVRKKDLTGSVGLVNMEDIAKAPVQSFDQALAGRIAGVQVSSNDGQPGAEGINIVIRGANSLTQSNSPLYVIDGFPIEDPENAALNPDDIASISILKDASATAIYGARGANGVVVIETKRGKTGKPVIGYNGSLGINQVTKRMEMMSPYEFVRYMLERNLTAATATYLKDGKTLDSYKSVPGINWQDQLFRTGSTQIHNLSIRGGNDQTRYSISGSINNADGIVVNSGQERYQGRISLDQTINKKLKTGVNINYSQIKSFGQLASPASVAGSATSTLMYAVWAYRPVTGGESDINDDNPLEDELMDPEIDHANDYRVNPIVSAKNELRQRRSTNLMANAYATYAITPELTLKVTAGINNRVDQRDEFYNENTSRGTPLLPSSRGVQANTANDSRRDWMNENTLTYKKRFGKHALDVVGGFTMQGFTREQKGYAMVQIPNPELGLSGMDEGIPVSSSSLYTGSNLASFLGRVNYNYKSKYLLTFSFRADGSSKFAPGNQWAYFPSGAAAWRMSDEKFMKGLRFISNAKLRGSFGVTGNNRVGDFSYLPSLTFPAADNYSWGNETPSKGVHADNLGNANLRWETTQQIDLGYDLGLFRDRVELNVDLYRKTTHDMLLRANMPYVTGYASAFKNIGKMQNQGLELTLTTVNVRNKNFSWESNFNISFNNSKVLALSDDETRMLSLVSWETAFNNSFLYVAEIGRPAAQFFGYIWDGVYQLEDFDQTPSGQYILKPDRSTNGSARANIKPGDIRYRDLNGDGVVDSYDQTVIGNTMPTHFGGFSNNFTYRGLSLHIFFQWAYGNQIYNANRLLFEGNGKGSGSINQFANYANRWTPENPSNTLHRAGGQGPGGAYSSRVLEDGSFLRLKTISLSYALPSAWLKRAHIRSLNVFSSVQNLYTWTNYSGMDPEVSTRNSTLTPGFDWSAYPRARTIVFGLNTSF